MFASLRIVEDSAGAVVAASQIKAVELGFFSMSNCFSSCFCTLQSAIPAFLRMVQSIQQYGSLSDTDVV